MADTVAPVLTLKFETASWNPGLRILRLKGRLDASGVANLEAGMSSEISKEPYRWAVDLSGVEYVSSAGVGSFLKILSQLERHKGELALFATPEKTMKVFKLLGFTASVKHFADENELKEKF